MQIKEVRVSQVQLEGRERWQCVIVAKSGSVRVSGRGLGDKFEEARENALIRANSQLDEASRWFPIGQERISLADLTDVPLLEAEHARTKTTRK